MKRRMLAVFLLALPLLVGAIIAGVFKMDIADSWNDSEDSQGAPVAVADQDAIIAAHQAAGDAASQGSFLKMGTEQFVDGTKELGKGSDELAAGTKAASSGAKELSEGLVQLQAATGQLGAGASQLTTGMDKAASAAAGLEAVRGQIVVALDSSIADLEGATDARSRELKAELEGLRAQAQSFSIDQNTVAELQAAQAGAQELSNQLNTPGFAYHDGIYSATSGAQELAAGLQDLEKGVTQALSGVDALEQGAAKTDQMASTTQDRIDDVQRALPTVASASHDGAGNGVAAQVLPPLYAFFIAGFVMFAATTWRRASWLVTWITGLAIVVLAGGLAAIVGSGLTIASTVMVAAIAAVALVTAAACVVLFTRFFGAATGTALAVLCLVLQAAFVGWVWNEAMTQSLGAGWEFLVRLFPLHYATAAITAVGNGIWGAQLWLSVVVLATVAVCAAGVNHWLLSPTRSPRHTLRRDDAGAAKQSAAPTTR